MDPTLFCHPRLHLERLPPAKAQALGRGPGLARGELQHVAELVDPVPAVGECDTLVNASVEV